MAADSKTEKATPKKRRDERKEGHIFFSKDIVSVVFIFGAFYSLKLLLPGMYQSTGSFMVHFVEMSGTQESLPSGMLQSIAGEFAKTCVSCLLPILLICMGLSIVATGAQTRFLFSRKSVAPKLSRLNPIKGIKNLFSLRNLVELLKSMLKIAILLYIMYGMLKDDFIAVVRTMDMDIRLSAVYMLNLIMDMIIDISLVFAVIAFFDYLYQRWEYERSIKMSKQELKEEYKQLEGNPEIKGKIKDIQRQRARSRMMQAVPQADVIIKNPTHFAVALKYKIDQDNAPLVLAKGQDHLALRIIEIGEAHGVTVVENKPLARSLYASTEINQEIPSEYYGAVAEILVYVYKLNKKDGASNEKTIK
ncbi:flagellar biosynthesis protein FlhB [Zhenpiania hominis]|uniref:Flagellar biosynthetic protein FlhB n=1 Tax=Zhenpiania hominis TaxID=2763644 RepID=A0A923NH57_9FIRM|nr:flagellar biosynthesis protein FlhB [Zhenpiania hominis]MBC6678324.1 flagellar biosynthesis protein FlhB [Zhenpiania hominis]